MKNRRIPVFAAVLVLIFLATAKADVIVTLHDGKEIKTASITYEKNILKLADGTTYPRNAVKRVSLIHRQAQIASAPSETSDDVRELLETAQEAVKRFPNAKSILLVDHGYEEKRADGRWLFRYRTAVKVLHSDKLSLAAQGMYFDDERQKARIVRARSIDPDGAVHDYDPASVKISEPSRDAVSFGRGKRLTYQIPEVKVGSIVDYTHEWEVFNPYDPEMFFPSWNFAGDEPFVHSRLEIVMPREQELYFATRNVPEEAQKPRIYPGRGTNTYIWEIRDQPGVIEESRMPPISDVVPRLECSPFKDWSYIKKWASERLLPRMEPSEELRQLVSEQTKGLNNPHEKIAALYHYVQRNIQYISIKGSIASGMCGHPAGETFSNKYGDCIDCAILFSAMLRVAGVQAYPVWVNTNDSPSITTEIPTLGGNHAIVEIHLDNRIFYLDPTATNYRYPTFRWDDHGVHAINPILARISPVPVPPSRECLVSNEYDITLSPEGDARIKHLSLRTGAWEAGARGFFLRANDEEIKKTLNSIVNSYSPGARLTHYDIKNTDDLSKQLEWRMEFDLPAYASRAGDLLIIKIPGVTYSFPEAALERRAYDIDYKSSEETRHRITINIPEGYAVKYLPAGGEDIELGSKHVTYRATCKQDNGRIVFEDSYRQITRFVPAPDYAQHRQLLRKIARYSKEHIFFERTDR